MTRKTKLSDTGHTWCSKGRTRTKVCWRATGRLCATTAAKSRVQYCMPAGIMLLNAAAAASSENTTRPMFNRAFTVFAHRIRRHGRAVSTAPAAASAPSSLWPGALFGFGFGASLWCGKNPTPSEPAVCRNCLASHRVRRVRVLWAARFTTLAKTTSPTPLFHRRPCLPWPRAAFARWRRGWGRSLTCSRSSATRRCLSSSRCRPPRAAASLSRPNI